MGSSGTRPKFLGLIHVYMYIKDVYWCSLKTINNVLKNSRNTWYHSPNHNICKRAHTHTHTNTHTCQRSQEISHQGWSLCYKQHSESPFTETRSLSSPPAEASEHEKYLLPRGASSEREARQERERGETVFSLFCLHHYGREVKRFWRFLLSLL